MPPISFLAVETVVLGLGIWCLYDSWSSGLRWLSTTIVGMLFGLLIECYFVLAYSGYAYGDFLVELPLGGGHSVPIWVAVGWGSIIYVAMRASDGLGLPWFSKPISDALLALSVDLCLDPVADALGWWSWSRPVEQDYFGVPFDNFLGWLMIVGFYALSVRAGREFFKPGPQAWWKDVFVPVVGLAMSVGAVAVTQMALDYVYGLVGEPLTFFGVFVMLLAGVLLSIEPDYKKTPIIVFWLPAAVHATVIVLMVGTGVWMETPELLAVLPLTALLSCGAFAYSSSDMQ